MAKLECSQPVSIHGQRDIITRLALGPELPLLAFCAPQHFWVTSSTLPVADFSCSSFSAADVERTITKAARPPELFVTKAISYCSLLYVCLDFLFKSDHCYS
jgi:hypothetical protein